MNLLVCIGVVVMEKVGSGHIMAGTLRIHFAEFAIAVKTQLGVNYAKHLVCITYNAIPLVIDKLVWFRQTVGIQGIG